MGVHPFEIAGPLLFYHAMTLITTQTADAVRTLTLRVTNLKLGDIEGENVGTAISQMRGALLRLKALDKEPNDIVDKILDTMQTSSVEKFNRFFENISFQLRLNPTAYNAEDILHLAEKTHREFVASGEWTGIHNTGSTFTASSPLSTSLGVSSNQPRRRWRRQGPKENESETLNRGGKIYFWCGRCRLWNTTHKTNEHVWGGPRQTKSANIATTPSLPGLPPPESSFLPDDRPAVLYSQFPIESFPSEASANPYLQGHTMALLSQQHHNLIRCQRDIDQLKVRLSSTPKSPHGHSSIE